MVKIRVLALAAFLPAALRAQPTLQQRTGDPHQLQIRKATEISAKGSFGAIGDTVPLKATLRTKRDDKPLAGKTLHFKVAGKAVGSAVTGPSGEAKVDYAVPSSPPPGAAPMEIHFSGDADSMPYSATASFGTIKSSTKIAFEPNPHINEGETARFRGSLVRITDKKGLDGRELTMTVNGDYAGKVKTEDGRFTLAYHVVKNFPPKATVHARFEGDGLYNPTAATMAFDVKNPVKTVYLTWPKAEGKVGESIPVKAYLTNMLGGGIAGERVKIWIDNRPRNDYPSCQTTTNSLGIAACHFKFERTGLFGIMAEAVVDPDKWKVEAKVYPRTLVVTPAPVNFVLSGPSSAHQHDRIRIKAKLTRATDNHPLTGEKVSLDATENYHLLPSQTTDSSGETIFEFKVSTGEGPRLYKATFRPGAGANYEKGDASITVNIHY